MHPEYVAILVRELWNVMIGWPGIDGRQTLQSRSFTMGDLKSTHLPVFVINVFWSGLRVAL
jgi:hypothetical protein